MGLDYGGAASRWGNGYGGWVGLHGQGAAFGCNARSPQWCLWNDCGDRYFAAQDCCPSSRWHRGAGDSDYGIAIGVRLGALGTTDRDRSVSLSEGGRERKTT